MTTATLAGLVLIGGFVLLLLMRVPISFAMLLATLGSALVTGTNFSVLVRQMVDGANNFSLLSIPFFILMGEIMGAGGISDKIIDLANLADTCDHWIHNGNFSICACAEQRAKLCLEDLRPRQADADRTAAKCRILLFFHLEIIALFVSTDIEGTDDDAFSRHRLCCLFVDTELLLLCWIVILLQIDKLASEQADAARVVLHDSRKVFDVSNISIQQNFLSVQCNIFFSL